MIGSTENYSRIQKLLIGAIVAVFALLAVLSIDSVEAVIVSKFGDRFLQYARLVPWGVFGAITHCAYLCAKDKAAQEGIERKSVQDASNASPIWPDEFDVRMYALFVLSGGLMAVLAAFLLSAGVGYLGQSTEGLSPIQEKFPLFALFAFWAGYSQTGLISRLQQGQ